jgi:hypothetical protein
MTPPYEHPGANVAFWTLFGFFALGEFAIGFRSRFKERHASEGWSLLAAIALASRDVGSIVPPGGRSSASGVC